jgi:hypothetical protein
LCVGLTHRSRRCLDSKCMCFCCHVTSIVGLVACNWWPVAWYPATNLLHLTGKLVTNWLPVYCLSDYCSLALRAIQYSSECITHCAPPPNERMMHHVSLFFSGSTIATTPHAELGCSMMPFIIWRRWDNPSSSEKRRRGSHRRWDNPSSGDSTL